MSSGRLLNSKAFTKEVLGFQSFEEASVSLDSLLARHPLLPS